VFIALRDLWFARGRFALMGAVVALVALLMVLLSGLATGLVDDNISGVRSLPASHLAFSADGGVAFNRSTVDRDQWEGLAATPGVTAAAPLGNTLFNGQAYADPDVAARASAEIARDGTAATKGTAVDLALFGMEPGSFIAPTPVDGSPLGSRPDGVLASKALLDKGVKIGDEIVLDRVGTKMVVVGTTGKDNYGHVPVVYAPLTLWQEATFGAPGSDPATEPPAIHRVATLVALNSSGADLAAADAALELKTVSKQEAFNGSPGYKEETGTLLMIEFFLYIIAAVLVAAFFTVWTIQRRHEIGLVKALGGSNRYLLKDAMGQAFIVLVVATAVGAAFGIALGAVIMAATPVPFALAVGPVTVAAVLVILMGLIGGALTIRRITSVDPLIALGGAR